MTKQKREIVTLAKRQRQKEGLLIRIALSDDLSTSYYSWGAYGRCPLFNSCPCVYIRRPLWNAIVHA